MKKSLIPCAAFAALMLTSCSNSPVDKMHDILDVFEDEIEDAESIEELNKAQMKMAKDLNDFVMKNRAEIEKIPNDDKEAIDIQERTRELNSVIEDKRKAMKAEQE